MGHPSKFEHWIDDIKKHYDQCFRPDNDTIAMFFKKIP